MFEDRENIKSIKEALLKKGFTKSYSDSYFERRLRMRMRKVGIQNYSEYSDMLRNSNRELELLKDELSIKVSNFNWNPKATPMPFQDEDSTFKDTEKIPLIRDLLLKKGFKVSYKDNYFHRRLRIRMRKIGINKFGDYYSILLKDNNEIEFLKKNLSINVTTFYRNPDTYKLFQEVFAWYMEEIVDNKKRPDIRIWSAGCAVGAEPYSIAMIVDQLLGSRKSNYNIDIYATDFNEELLAFAREGIYDKEYLSDLPQGLKHKYFEQVDLDSYRITDTITSMVSFSHLDLATNTFPFKNLDIIFCRNVLIYFDKDLKKRLFERFYDLLAPNGIMVLGRTEAISLDYKDNFNSLSLKHRIYQKGSGSTRKQYTDEQPVPQYKCKICGEIFYRLNDLESHQTKHQRENKVFKCKICRKLLKNEIRLKVHMQIAHREIEK
ncbi:MAG: CheR family methyltransferase [Candidatus Odinarchaeota archaeon]